MIASRLDDSNAMSSFDDRLRNDFPSPTPKTPSACYSVQPSTTFDAKQREAVERMISTSPPPSPPPSSPSAVSLGSLPRRIRYFVSAIVNALLARGRPILPAPPLDEFLCCMHIAHRALVVCIAHAHRKRRAAETFRLTLSDGAPSALSPSAVTLHVERDGRTWTTTISDEAALRLAVRTLNALPTPITSPRRQSKLNFTLNRDESRSDDDNDTNSDDDADWCAAAAESAHRMTNKTFRPPTPITTTPALTTSPAPTLLDVSCNLTSAFAQFVVVSSDERRIHLRRARFSDVRRPSECDAALSLLRTTPQTPPHLRRRRRRFRYRPTRNDDLTDDGDDFLIVKPPIPTPTPTPPTQLTPPHNTSTPPLPLTNADSSQIQRRRQCRRTRIEVFSPIAAHFDISNAADALATADDPIDNGR